MGRFNLTTALLDEHLEGGHGDRAAIIHRAAAGEEAGLSGAGERRTTTYDRLASLAGRVGNALRGLGVEREQRVAILLVDSPEFIATFLGTARIGAVAVPLNTLLRPAEQAELVQHCEATALVVTDAILEGLRPLLPALPALRLVIVVGRPSADALAFETLCAAASPELTPAATDETDMCFWQYSSGTTGRPKAVVHRHRDLYEVAERYGRSVVAMTSDDRSFSIAKLFFSYGLGNSLAFPLRFGATAIVHSGKPDPRAVFEIARRERPTLFYAVPTAYAALLAAADADPASADLGSVRLCISAGEALPAPLFERWKSRFGHEILDGIGSTEVGYIFISNVPGRVRPGTSGQVVPGYQAKVADADGRGLPAGETGDLWVRGPSTFAEYWNDPQRTARTLRDGWVVTGDKYRVDEEGYFRYEGRIDDMLKVGGMWVSPAEVEAALCAHPAVLEAAVVGRRDGEGLVKPAAFVVLGAPGSASEAMSSELVEFVARRIAPYKRPRWIHFVADLPKTTTGKIQRYKLRDAREEVAS